MQYRNIPKLGIKVSAFGLGCMRFPMKTTEKYRALLTGMAFHRWGKEEIDTAGNLAMDILSELPMYRLRNRADEESVEVLEKEIGGTLYDI